MNRDYVTILYGDACIVIHYRKKKVQHPLLCTMNYLRHSIVVTLVLALTRVGVDSSLDEITQQICAYQ